MKKITVMFAAVAMIFMTAACGGNKNGEQKADATEQVADSTLEVDYVLENADSLAGQDIRLEGVCTHICAHGAGKIFLMGSDSTKTIRIQAGELGSFDKKCVNSIVSVDGKLVEERIDEAYLVKWEAEMKQKCEEQHGEGEGGCATEKNARGEKADTPEQRIADFRKQIKEREAKEGKAYLSFYFVEAKKYEIK